MGQEICGQEENAKVEPDTLQMGEQEGEVPQVIVHQNLEAKDEPPQNFAIEMEEDIRVSKAVEKRVDELGEVQYPPSEKEISGTQMDPYRLHNDSIYEG